MSRDSKRNVSNGLDRGGEPRKIEESIANILSQCTGASLTTESHREAAGELVDGIGSSRCALHAWCPTTPPLA